jgi:hypothetical protein
MVGLLIRYVGFLCIFLTSFDSLSPSLDLSLSLKQDSLDTST